LTFCNEVIAVDMYVTLWLVNQRPRQTWWLSWVWSRSSW